MRKFIHVFLLLIIGQELLAQKLTDAEVKSLLDSGQYIFKAQQMLPTGARSRMITDINYTFRVSAEELTADLPYIGRAYQASANPADGGVKFTSRKFTREQKEGKKGSVDVKFTIKDDPDARECILTVYSNGNASLLCTFNRRQNISYQGVLVKTEPLR